MAKIERSINEDFDQLLSNIENGILNSSISATLEDASDFQSGTARCSVRIFERYSYAGGNRVSLNITLFQNGEDPVQLSAITAGGSQAVFFKINTLGEEAFLDKLIELLDVYLSFEDNKCTGLIAVFYGIDINISSPSQQYISSKS